MVRDAARHEWNSSRTSVTSDMHQCALGLPRIAYRAILESVGGPFYLLELLDDNNKPEEVVRYWDRSSQTKPKPTPRFKHV
jgi:hypothetical protein